MKIIKNKDVAKEFASKCSSRTDFFKKYQTLYKLSREKGWLDEFFGKVMPKYSLKINVIKEAKKYKSLKEFHDKNNNAWKSAKHNGWLKEMEWFNNKNEILKNRKYYVYKIEIVSLNSVYIGITCQKEGERWKEHNTSFNKKTNKYDTVKQFCIDNSINMPYEIILENNLSCEEAQYYEKYYIEEFMKNGYNILNKGKCGIGSSAIGNSYKWNSEEKIIKEGKKYKNCEEFKNKSGGAYNAAKKYNLLEKIFGKNKGLVYSNWKNKEKTINEGKKYKNRTDFFRHNKGAYGSALKHGWIDEIFPIDRNTIISEALKYKDRLEFRKNNLPLFKKASEEKILDEIFPFSLDYFNNISKKYINAKEFKEKNYFYYNQARKYGYLKKLKYA